MPMFLDDNLGGQRDEWMEMVVRQVPGLMKSA